MSNKYKVLVVEDELNIRSFTETILEANGYQALGAATCSEADLIYASHRPDVVILDLGLPDRDGLEFIKTVRATNATPIIVLSARALEEDKITALDLGANDYITKPFGTGELLARLRAVLRSARSASAAGALPGGKFSAGELEVDYDMRSVTVRGQEVRLTQTEYNIISLLSLHTGRVMTYSAMIREIWGESDSGSVKKLQVNMANIRKKLGVKPGEQRFIANELGVGYRMLDGEQ